MATTIRDVAERAQVAVSTVSRVLTGSGPASQETMARVRQAARDLGYEPNPWASRLRSGTTRQIAMIIPDLRNPFFADLVKGAQSRARDLGYVLFVSDTDNDVRTELDVLRMVGERADGILLCTPRNTQPVIEEMTEHVPTVLLHRTSDVLPYVISDVADGIAQAIRNLTALGHRHIAYVDGPVQSWSANLRRNAIASVALPAGVDIDTVGQVEASFEGGVAGGDLAIASGATAVLAFNDVVALGLMNRLLSRGVTIPEDISVVGYDDVPIARMCTPTLTTVSQPLLASARLATEMLADVINAVPLTQREVVLPTRLAVRQSTGAPRQG